MIMQNGGYLAEGEVDGIVCVTSKSHLGGFVRIDYIDDCVSVGQLLPFEGYTIPATSSLIDDEDDVGAREDIIDILGLTQHGQQQQQAGKRNEFINSTIGTASTTTSVNANEGTYKQSLVKLTIPSNRYTEEKDEYILEQVRRNPRFRNSHVLFHDLATHEMLKPHTGNSIRSRYRRHLAPRLHYVYKTNDRDKLIKDKQGRLIKVLIEDLLSLETIKTKFTPLDDYEMCCLAVVYIKNEAAKMGLDYDENNPHQKSILPYSFTIHCIINFPGIRCIHGVIVVGNLLVVMLIFSLTRIIMKRVWLMVMFHGC